MAKFKADIKFTKSWDKLKAMLTPGKIDANLKIQVGRATRLNGKLAAREIRKTMKKGGFEGNSPLTKFIKGSNKPLVDKGNIFKSITSVVLTPFTAEVGFIRGSTNANVGIVIHEGAIIKVTPAMRGMFAALASVSDGSASPASLSGRAKELWERRPKSGWKALKPSTTAIKIPARPFIKKTMENPLLNKLMGDNWNAAVAAAIVGKKAKLKSSFI